MQNGEIPYHLGIIMDGNRRWAKERGLPVLEGHRQGIERVKEIVKRCQSRGIKALTLYTFSTENWSRPLKEINFLMKLAIQPLVKNIIQTFHQAGVRIRVIGQRDVLREKLPRSLQKIIREAEELTKNNEGMTLNIALSYGGQAEIVETVKKIVRAGVPVEEITEELISKNLWTGDLPENQRKVDLIIRTAGEQRLSNFLIWQAAYSELYFSSKYWPDFTGEDLDEALEEFSRRKRRFGK